MNQAVCGSSRSRVLPAHTTSECGSVGIPAKLNVRKGSERHSGTRTRSERSDAGTSIVKEVFGFVKRKRSGAQRRKDAASGERGAGKGAAALVPASAHRGPERGERSGLATG